MTVSDDELTFTPGNWDTPQTVTVTGEDDADALDHPGLIITHDPSDADYNSVASVDKTVNVTDDEPKVSISFDSDTESGTEGDAVTITVTLDQAPNRMLDIPLTITNGSGTTSADYTLNRQKVTFTGTETSATITLTSTGDNVDEEDETITISLPGSLPPKVTAGTHASTVITIGDDDTRGATLSPPALTVGEGSSNTYTLKFNSQPTADVTVTISTTGSPDVSTTTNSLIFTTTNWDTAQTVIVSAAQDDGDADDDRATIVHRFNGGDYSALSDLEVEVTVTDDEPAVTVQFSETTHSVSESDQGTPDDPNTTDDEDGPRRQGR